MKRILLFSYLFLLASLSSFSQDVTRGAITEQNTSDSIQRNFALVVGISSYPNINRLLYADDDAYLFSDYLVNEKICEKKNVTLLIDSVATKANFFKELRKILDKTGANDRIFIYFAGHGDVENDIESGFLLTYNCEPNNYPATDAIDISMLEKFVMAFTKKNTKVVLITDACRSGNLAGGMTGASSTITSLSKGFQNVIKILSCQPNQLSIEKNYPGGGHGVFTYHLIDGLSGLADKDNDHTISLRELDRYLDEVGTETAQQQVPKTDGDPQVKIASFNEELKQALIARKGNNSGIAATKKRGVSDSTWTSNTFFQAFDQHIRKLRLTEPEKNNAYHTIKEAEKAKQPAALVEEMKLELAAVLEDEAQKFINVYLRGALGVDNKEILRQITSALNYMVTIEKIIGEKDFRYNEIHVKKLFLEAYYIFKLKNKQKFPEALAYLVTANKLLNNQAWICNAMGLFYEDFKQYDEAEISYKKAVSLASHWSYPWNNLCLLYRKQLRYPEAEAAIKKALLLDSSYGNSWNTFGTILHDLERYPEAELAYEKAIEIDSICDTYWDNLGGLLYSLERYTEAEEAYKKAIQFNSNNTDPWFGLGRTYSVVKQYSDAETAYKTAITIDSNNAYAWTGMGSLFDDLGRYSESLEAYKKAVQIEPDNTVAWNGAGIAYKALREYAEAETAFKKAIRIDSADIYPWYNLGRLYQYQDKHAESAACFKKVVAINPTEENYWYYLNDMLAMAGLEEEQIKWLIKKHTHFPEDHTILSKIAFFYLGRKDYPNAEVYFIQALKRYPENAMLNYDITGLYSLWDKKDSAIKYLEIAFKNGFDNFHLLEIDPDLENIRTTPAFITLIKKYKEN